MGFVASRSSAPSADESESIATIHAALDAGITLLDTGDYYGAGHNELLIGRALRDRRDKAVLSVKFGALRGPDGGWLGMDTRPAAVKNFAAYTPAKEVEDSVFQDQLCAKLAEMTGVSLF